VTVHSRRVSSVPKRTPSETWRAICDLLAPPESVARPELDQMVGLASMLIADEYSCRDPIVVSGGGPQLRIYTLHGDEALEDEAVEDPFAFDPTTGEWNVSFPCGENDLEEAETIAGMFPRAEVRLLGTRSNQTESATSRSRPVIDLFELERE